MTTAIATASTLAAHDPSWNGPGPWWPIFPFLWLLFIIGIFASFVRARRLAADPNDQKLPAVSEPASTPGAGVND